MQLEHTHTPPAAPPRRRSFVDGAHREWRVREMSGSPYEARPSRALIFESVGHARRVREYPANWYELSDAELLALCEGSPLGG